MRTRKGEHGDQHGPGSRTYHVHEVEDIGGASATTPVAKPIRWPGDSGKRRRRRTRLGRVSRDRADAVIPLQRARTRPVHP